VREREREREGKGKKRSEEEQIIENEVGEASCRERRGVGKVAPVRAGGPTVIERLHETF